MAGKVHLLSAALLVAAASAAQWADAACLEAGGAKPDAADMHDAQVMYLPTPHHVVSAMLRLAGVSQADRVYDLGSGDGRIPIAAAQVYGARSVGIEIDGRMIKRARCNASEAGVEGLVEFRQDDLFGTDLREATVVTLFLFPEMVQRLMPRLRAELRPGTRIVSHRFGASTWQPDRTIEAGGHPLLLWTVPAR